ncbi:MAG: hypothetical protein OK454_01805 [Thaumarchaeota archaeon]|nr:hypothetical protein [Nitrososphaerota archaeon]
MGKKRKKAPSITERLKAGETAEEIFGPEKRNEELAKAGIFDRDNVHLMPKGTVFDGTIRNLVGETKIFR